MDPLPCSLNPGVCKRFVLPDLSEYIYPIIPLMPVSVKVPLLIRIFRSPKSAIFGCERII